MYACTQIDAANNCTQWTEILYGLPVLTTADVQTLGSATALSFSVAFALGLLVRVILHAGANRFQ